MNLKLKSIYITALAIILPFVVIVYSLAYPFFWDTLLTSTVTQYFFNHGFHQGIIPTEWDAGHPPFFYGYITLCYHIFGKSLVTAHTAMLPIAILGSLSFVQLLRHFAFSNVQQTLALLLFFAIPAVTTQYSLVSYDAVLLTAYLMGLNAGVRKQKILLAAAAVIMVSVSLRGAILLGALSITIFFMERKHVRKWLQMQWLFVPAGLMMLGWYAYHHAQTGWWLSTPAEGWSDHRGWATGYGLLKNMISIIRAHVDLGAVWLSLGALFYLVRKKEIDKMSALWLVPIIILSLSFLPFSNPINHRYYLVVLVAMLPSVVLWLSSVKNIWTAVWIIGLLFGHIQLYPGAISNGWDCTLAHTEYFSQRDSLDVVLQEMGIDKEKVATVFPMNNSRLQTHLVGDSIRMQNIHGKPLDSAVYVLYSNIGNDFSDDQIMQLQLWKVLWQSKKGVVDMVLYQNPQDINK